jgi:hypothetical protein
MRVAL